MASNVDQSVLAVPSTQLREAYFEMCFHMGIVQIALDPRPPCQTGKRGKKCPKPPWQALTTPGTWEKSAQTILAVLYTSPTP